jgi:AcrR family transcriptional regulator
MRTIATREDIVDLILDAADRLPAEKGYKRMAMEDLAQGVGIAKGTIYLQFPSKEELVLSHIDRIIGRLKIELLMIAQSEDPPAERLHRMLVLRVMFRFDSVQHYSESLNVLLSSIRSALLARRDLYFVEEAGIFAEVLRQGQFKGTFAEVDIFPTAHALLLATNALLPYNLSAGELGQRTDLEKKVSRIADLLLRGLILRK